MEPNPRTPNRDKVNQYAAALAEGAWTPPPMSQRGALNAALYTLKQVRDAAPCGPGHLKAEEPCPHTLARLVLNQLKDQPPRAPYTRPVLLAVLRGLVIGEEAHVLVSCGGHTHHATLEPVVGLPPDEPFQFAATTTCGRRIAPLNPDDVLEVDVHYVGLTDDQATALAMMRTAEELSRPEKDTAPDRADRKP